MAILEASNSPMAERLLLAARSETGKVLSRSAWRVLVADLKMHDTELNRYVALENYAHDHGLLVTESQYVALLRLFASPAGYQTNVRELLRTRRIEYRKKRG